MSERLVTKEWTVAEFDRPRNMALSREAGVPPIAAHLLLSRGIETAAQAEVFLHPSLGQLSDPFSLTDMDRAVARITRARDAGERVLIFGDYDVDGVTSTAILINAFKRFGLTDFTYGMPLRLSEGYGLNTERVEAAKAGGVSLIVTVDNGISAHEAAGRAKALGIDLVVTDHHAVEGGLPEAAAVVNPRREAAEHPCASMSGAGVAFKLATALNGTPNDLDIAAVGTVADIVPLRDENRVIVALGLRHMVRHQRNGLAQLAKAAGFELPEVSAERIGFQLGPRLNAAGRMDDSEMALKLLLSECPDEAGATAKLLDTANQERQSVERAIYQEVLEELEAVFSPEQRSIVVAREGWHPGVIGIVASRVEGRYNRPVAIISLDEDGTGRASARSGQTFNFIEALNACPQLFEQYGGHRAAAGFTIRQEHIPAFAEVFEAEALRQLGPGLLPRELGIDAVAAFSEIDSALVKTLELLEPIGQGNPAPLFCSLGVDIVPRSARVLKDLHLKLSFRQDEVVLPAIGFGMAEEYYLTDFEQPVDIAYTPQFNTWHGQTSIQLLLKDIRAAQ